MDAMYIPGLKYTLFSVFAIVNSIARAIFEANGCTFEKGQVRMRANSHNDGTMVSLTAVEKWHARLADPSVYAFKEVRLTKKLGMGFEVCPKAKLRGRPHRSDPKGRTPLDRLSIDLIGPIPFASRAGQVYA